MEISIKDSLKAISVKGSKAHVDYLVYRDLMKPYNDQSMALNNQYREFAKNKDEEGKKRIETQFGELDKTNGCKNPGIS
jgi:hypothetical protein